MINLNGKQYMNYVEIAKEYNINYDTLLARIRRGWTLEDAVKPHKEKMEKPIKENRHKITINGVVYNSQSDAMKKLNLNRYQLKRLIENGSVDSQRANKIVVIIDNETVVFPSIRQFCLKYDLCYTNFCSDYRKDKTIAQKIVNSKIVDSKN